MSSEDLQSKSEVELVTTSEAKSKSKTPEATALKILTNNGSIVTGTHVSNLNRFLAMLFKVPWIHLACALATIFVVLAFLFGAIFKGLNCNKDDNYIDISLLTLLQLFGGNGTDDLVFDERNCVVVACVVSVTTILIQALVFSAVIARFMNPSVEVAVTNHMICKLRNGQRVLQFRVASQNGHPISDFKVGCAWLRQETTQEGESFLRSVPLPLQGFGPVMALPTICTHCIDESSPLWGMEDIRTARGMILALISGTDSILRTELDQVQMFSFAEVEYDRTFVNCLVVPFSAAVKDGSRPEWDLSKFSETQPI